MKFSTKLTVVALGLTGIVGGAQATLLVSNAPTTNVDVINTFFGGTMLDSAITNIANISYTGFARTAVYDTGTGLDFYYQFASSPASVNGVERFSGYNFKALGDSVVNVYQSTAAFGIFTAGNVESDTADRTKLGVIGFNFIVDESAKLEPGQTSFVQVIRTNARTYTTGNFGLLDGIGDNATGFGAASMAAPVAAVPEPETYALMLAGLGMMATIARRRKSKKA
jgi:hypothetical protein